MAGAERDESIPAMVRELADDAVRLAKAEIELAKAEAIAAVKRMAVAVAFFAAAAFFLLMMVIFALGSVPTALAGHIFSGWLWWLLMAALFLLAGGALALVGLRSMKRSFGTGKELVGSVKEDVTWLKRLTKRNASGS